MIPQGGIGATGTIGFGGGDTDGRIANLDVRPLDNGQALVAFEHEIEGDPQHQFPLYVNSQAVRLVQPRITPAADTTTITGEIIGPLAEETNDVGVIAVRLSEPGAPFILQPSPTGDRFTLYWCRTPDTDLFAYRVYWDEGEDVVPTTLLEEINLVESEQPQDATPTTGTGTGRIAVSGLWRGGIANEPITITIGAGGTFSATSPEGPVASEPILPGVEYNIPDGLRVEFLDPASAYDEGDTYEWFVGVRNYYITEALSAGDYRFRVTAVDHAGNESAATPEVAGTLAPVVNPPQNIVGEWDQSTTEITLTWEPPADLPPVGGTPSYRIYSSFNQVTGEVGEYVLEDAPLDEVEPTSFVLDIGHTPERVVLFYVRAVLDGVEEDNAFLVRVAAFTAPELAIPAPSMIDVVPIAGANVIATWSFPLEDVTPDEFAVFISTSASWDDATEAARLSFAPQNTPTSSTLIAVQAWTSATGFTDAVQAWVGVRAVIDSELGPPSDLLPVTPDGTAPATPACINLA